MLLRLPDARLQHDQVHVLVLRGFTLRSLVHLLGFCSAGPKRTAPYVRVPQTMDKVERYHVGGSERRRLKVCVFLRQKFPNQVHTVSTSKYPGFTAHRVYKKANGEVHTGMCGEEYLHAVQKAVENSVQHATRGELSSMVLLHDRDPAHKDSTVSSWCETKGINIELLPERSPDLDPLDYGLFGVAKQNLDSSVQRQKLGWGARCAELLNILQTQPADATIGELPLRWQACIQARGRHFDQQLRKLKKKAKMAKGQAGR
jgi:hypothetical protein